MIKRLLIGLICMAASVTVLADRGPWYVLGRGLGGTFVVIPGTRIEVTDNAQTIVNAHAAGTTYVLAAGVHRLQTITPKTGDTFTGESGAILSGARLLTSASATMTSCHGIQCWYYDGQTQRGALVIDSNGCSGNANIEGVTWNAGNVCFEPEDVFYDGVFKVHCLSFGDCPAGGWYLDYDGSATGHASRLYVFDNPSGHVVEASVTELAMDLSFQSNVTLSNFVIEHFATAYAEAAITITNGDIMDTVEVRYNHYAGMAPGSNGIIRNSHSHHNGCAGSIGGGNGQLLNSELDHNNYVHEFNDFWGCGGSKMNQANGPVLSGNYVHDNDALGLWCDTSCRNQTYDSNIINDNLGAGIYLEIGYNAVVSNNSISRNGLRHSTPPSYTVDSGIGVVSSGQIEIKNNTLTDNYGSIQGLLDDRCNVSGPAQSGTAPNSGFWVLQNLNVHDNTTNTTNPAYMNQASFTGIREALDGGQVCTPDAWSPAANNVWSHNTYNFGTYASGWFNWSGGSFNVLTIAQWQAIPQDTTGTFH